MLEIRYSSGDIVELVWNDISVTPNWMEQSEVEESPKDNGCKVVGYYVNKSANFVILAGISGTHSADLNGIIHIPSGCITEHRKLS